MQAGVDNQARRAKRVGGEIADLAQRIVVIHAKLVGDLFGIEAPAFAIGGDRSRLAIERQLAVLELQRPFEQMSRRAFVIGEGGEGIARPFGGIAQVDEEDRSEEHTSELQSLMRISYAVFCLKKKKKIRQT